MTTSVHSISIATATATATGIKKGLSASTGIKKTIRSFFISAAANASQSSSEPVGGDDSKGVGCSKRSNPLLSPLVDDTCAIGSSIDTCDGSSSLKRSRQSNDSIAPSSAGSLSSDAVPSQWRPFDQLESGWRAELSDETSKPSFRSLLRFLDAELQAGRTIYPSAGDVFTAFNLCPLDQVKVNYSMYAELTTRWDTAYSSQLQP